MGGQHLGHLLGGLDVGVGQAELREVGVPPDEGGGLVLEDGQQVAQLLDGGPLRLQLVAADVHADAQFVGGVGGRPGARAVGVVVDRDVSHAGEATASAAGSGPGARRRPSAGRSGGPAHPGRRRRRPSGGAVGVPGGSHREGSSVVTGHGCPAPPRGAARLPPVRRHGGRPDGRHGLRRTVGWWHGQVPRSRTRRSTGRSASSWRHGTPTEAHVPVTAGRTARCPSAGPTYAPSRGPGDPPPDNGRCRLAPAIPHDDRLEGPERARHRHGAQRDHRRHRGDRRRRRRAPGPGGWGRRGGPRPSRLASDPLDRARTGRPPRGVGPRRGTARGGPASG